MRFYILTVVVLSFICTPWSFSQEVQLSAEQILTKVDEVTNAPKDQELRIKLLLIDNKGAMEEREIIMYQKGSDKRVAKFLSPASQRGIGVLSLPNDVMYLYLPAFKKTRRIASHIKNTKFAGTDFTYEDMEAIRYSERYIPELLKMEGQYFVLQLRPKKDVKTDYSKLVLWVPKDTFFPTKIEYYDKTGRLMKVMRRDKVEQKGQYLIAKESEMEDMVEKHISRMIIIDAKFDTGLSDDIFTERFLSR